METFTVQTHNHKEIVDITDKVEAIVAKSKIKEGCCIISVPHATAAVILNEYEPRLEKDFLSFFEKLVPKGNYMHNQIDDNAEAHLASALFGQSKILPISGGKLIHGIWQQVLLCEFDGPRERKVVVLCK